MTRQLPIPGTEPPRNAGIEEIVSAIDEQRAKVKRETDILHKLEATLATRMLDAKAANYDFVADNGKSYTAELTLPELPKVKVKCIGTRQADE